MSKKRIAAVAILLAILMIVLFSYDANAEDECNFDPPAYYSAEYIERFKEEDFYNLDTVDVVDVPEVPVEEEMVTVTLSEIVDETVVEPNQSDVELLASVIHGESGADFCSDTMRYYVGSVVLNRISHEKFPNTMQEVVYQPGQYGCVNGKYFKADDRCRDIARDLLMNGSKLPSDVVYQSNAKLGHGVYIKEQNMYFCWI